MSGRRGLITVGRRHGPPPAQVCHCGRRQARRRATVGDGGQSRAEQDEGGRREGGAEGRGEADGGRGVEGLEEGGGIAT
jgi:hypothetical protein